MLDYHGFGYRPDYGFELYRNGTLVDKDAHVEWAACFSRVFHLLTGPDREYYGVYTLRCRKKFRENSGNYCTLDKPDILKMMRYMRRVCGINIHLSEDDVNYTFVFKITGKPIRHKFVLTFSRVFFEFPYTEFAKDVFKLRAQGVVNGVDYTHRNFLELFNIVSATYWDGWGTNHALWAYASAGVTTQHLRKQLQSNISRVQDVLDGKEKVQRKIKRLGEPANIEWEEDFEKRVVKYSENFQIIKNIKQNEKNLRRRARKAV